MKHAKSMATKANQRKLYLQRIGMVKRPRQVPVLTQEARECFGLIEKSEQFSFEHIYAALLEATKK